MFEVILVDSSTLINLVKMYGEQGLDMLFNEGKQVIITERIRSETTKNPINFPNIDGVIKQWIDKNSGSHNARIKVVPDPPGAAALEAQGKTKNLGEKGLLEWAEANRQTYSAQIYSDDKFVENRRLSNNAGNPLPGTSGPAKTSVQLMNEELKTGRLNPFSYSSATEKLKGNNFVEPFKLKPLDFAKATNDYFKLPQNASQAQQFAKPLAALGLALMALDIATSAKQAADQLKAGDRASAAQTLAQLAGRLAGGVAGAEAGSAIGAALGAIVGPGGMAVGVIVGGIIGGVAGAVAGQAAADAIWEALKHVNDIVDSLIRTIVEGPNLLPPNLQLAIAAFLDLYRTFAAPRDPLVFTFGQGLPSLTSVTNSPTYYDFDNQGFAVQTGWIGPSAYLLEWLDSQGNFHLLGAQSGNAFADLSALDLNADGRIDGIDAAFADLRLWADLNQDGVAAAEELTTLGQAGVSAINLNWQAMTAIVNGNAIVASATFEYAGGQIGTVHEVDFATNPVRSVYTPPSGFQYDQVSLALPELRGYGLLPDLRIAMTLDPVLAGKASALMAVASTLTAQQFKDAFADLLYQWAGVASKDPASRGPNVDARQYDFLLKLYGLDPSQPNAFTVSNPNAAAGSRNAQMFSDIMREMMVRFAAQVDSSLAIASAGFLGQSNGVFDVFATVEYDPSTDGLDFDLRSLVAAFADGLPAEPEAAQQYLDFASLLLGGLKIDVHHQFGLGTSQLAVNIAMFAEGADLSTDIVRALLGPTLDASLSIIEANPAAASFSMGGGASLLVLGDSEENIPASTAPLMITGTSRVNGYLYWKNVGRDIVVADPGAVLNFADLALSDLVMERHGGDLLIRVLETDHTLTIQGHFIAGIGLQQFWFEDGVTQDWGHDRASLLETVPFVAGPGDETIVADGGKRTLIAGPGNVTMVGGNGDNTFVYGAGDGNLVVRYARAPTWTANVNTLRFDDLNAADVTFARSGGVLTVTVNATGKVVTIENEFVTSGLAVVQGAHASDGSALIDDIFNAGIDRIVFADGSTWSRYDLRVMLPTHAGTSGDDAIIATAVNDTIVGGAGNDTQQGGAGNDLYVYRRGDGADTIIEGLNGDSGDKLVLRGVAPSEVSLLRSGTDITLVIAPSVSGGTDGGSVLLKGGTEDAYNQAVEQIVFDDGTVWTRTTMRTALLAQMSTSGNDTIVGFSAWDTITGGLGDDVLQGGTGGDTYIYNRGDGADTIIEDLNGDNGDKLVLHGVAPGEVSLLRNGTDITLVIAPSVPGGADGGSVLLKGGTEDAYYQAVEQIVFDDGTVWTRTTMRTALLAQMATSGNDNIVGFSAWDTIAGGLGDDILQGGLGGDTYIYNRGDGADTIIEGTNGDNADKLVLHGVAPAEVGLVRNGTDITLVIAPSVPGGTDGGSVLLKGGTEDAFNQAVEQIVFDNGTTWTRTTMRTALLAQMATSGNDNIVGFSAWDTITGGLGNDTLQGGLGNDTYVYSRGDGADTIIEGLDGGTADKVVLQGVNPGDVSLTRNGNDVTLVIGPSVPGGTDGGSILLKAEFDDIFYQGVEQIVFADGTVWTRADLRARLISYAGTPGNDTIVGSNAADIIAGGLGSDTLQGGLGNDTYIYNRGDGADTIIEGTNGDSGDKLVLRGIAPAEVGLVRNGTDITLVIAPSVLGGMDGGSVLLKGGTEDAYYQAVEQIVFDDGTVWTRTTMRTALLAQMATSGNDNIVGFSAWDMIAGGLGDDVLQGGLGGDTYIYNRGDGADTIIEGTNGDTGDKLVLHGIAPAEVSLVRNGTDITLVIAPSVPGGTDGGSVLLKGGTEDAYNQAVEQIVFDNGTTWTRTTMRTMLLAQMATSGNDTIVGFSAWDTIAGGLGDDVLQGGLGGDTYIYNRGDGADTIIEGTNGDTGDKLVLHGITPAEVSLLRNGTDITLVIAPSVPGGADGGSVLLKGGTEDAYNQAVEQIVFDNGTTWTRPILRTMLLAQASTLGDDTIVGFSAWDTITGGLGNDTLHGAGGADTYLYNRGDGADTIIEGVDAGQIDKLMLQGINSADVLAVRSGSDVLLMIAPSSAAGLDGGSVLLKSQLNDVNGQGVEQVAFAGGVTWNNAQIKAAAGYQAGPGGVTLQAPNGGAVLISGSGNDTLLGGNGADTFVMPTGAGNDSITASLGNGADTLKFDRWIAHDQLWFVQAGNDLVVSVIGQNQSATVSNWYTAGNNHLGKVLAGDGYAVTDSGMQQLVQAMASFSPPPAGQTTLPPELAANLAGALAANWQHT